MEVNTGTFRPYNAGEMIGKVEPYIAHAKATRLSGHSFLVIVSPRT